MVAQVQMALRVLVLVAAAGLVQPDQAQPLIVVAMVAMEQPHPYQVRQQPMVVVAGEEVEV